MILGRDAVNGLIWLRNVSVDISSSGPHRVKEGDEGDEPIRPPLGFNTVADWMGTLSKSKPLPPSLIELGEPLLWDGDNS